MVFGPAVFDFEMYFSVGCNAHAQRTIFPPIKAFHANWSVLRGFLSRCDRFRGIFKYMTAHACAGEDFYAFQSF